jgi:hypothetical protein
MNFKDLTKEQKQHIALGGIVATALIVIIVFGIKVSLSSISVARLESNDVTGKIESADRALAMQSKVREEFAQTMRELKEHLQNIPPDRNYYSWATEIIYSKARLTGLEIDAIDEQTRSGIPSKGGNNKELKLESYSLRVTAHGGYETLKQFLELIEKDHPLARVTGVDISTGTDSEIHDMQLVIQWPFNLSVVTDAWASIDIKHPITEDPVPATANPEESGRPKMPPPPPPRTEQQS